MMRSTIFSDHLYRTALLNESYHICKSWLNLSLKWLHARTIARNFVSIKIIANTQFKLVHGHAHKQAITIFNLTLTKVHTKIPVTEHKSMALHVYIH